MSSDPPLPTRVATTLPTVLTPHRNGLRAERGPGGSSAGNTPPHSQPRLGLKGLLLVVPVALLLAIGAGGAERSTLVLTPLVTFALPPLIMVAFWWDDWPGAALRASWSGWFDTVLVAIAAVLLAIAGQAVVGHVDLRVIFDPTPGSADSATFPGTLPLAGTAFVAMLQITLVNEGWPLRNLGRRIGGVVALAVAWAIALAVYKIVVDVPVPPGTSPSDRGGLLSGAELGAVLVVIGAWQVLLFVVWRGWPFLQLGRRAVRLVSANTTVIAAALLTYICAHTIGSLTPATITAASGAIVAAGLVVGMLFDVDPGRSRRAGGTRLAALAVVIVLATILYAGLTELADTLRWSRVTPPQWVGHVSLNAIAVAVILHVAVGRRWPFNKNTEHTPTPAESKSMTSSSPINNRQLISRAFEAWQAGTSPITDIFATDMTWTIEGHSLASKSYKTKQEFIDEVLAPFGARFAHGQPFRPSEIRAVHADGDTVVVLWNGHGIANDGRPYDNTYAWIMRLAGGLVVDGTAFYDSISFNDLWTRVTPAA